MITTVILDILHGTIKIVLFPIKQLPDASLPAGLTDALTSVPAHLGPLDFVLPLATIYAIIGLFVLVEGGFLAWHLINWIIKKIPTIS